MMERHLAEARVLLKARDRPGPPGPPPAWNPDLIWRPESSRWVLPPEYDDNWGDALVDPQRWHTIFAGKDFEGEPFQYTIELEAIFDDIDVIARHEFDPTKAPSYYQVGRYRDQVADVEHTLNRFRTAQKMQVWLRSVIDGDYKGAPMREVMKSFGLTRYCGSSDSWEVNADLRQGVGLRTSGYRAGIAAGVQMAMRPLEEPQVLFRGMRVDSLKDLLQQTQLDSFMSCSRRADYAAGWAMRRHDKEGESVLLEIVAKGSAVGVTLANDDTEPVTKFDAREDETILNVGQPIRMRYMGQGSHGPKDLSSVALIRAVVG